MNKDKHNIKIVKGDFQNSSSKNIPRCEKDLKRIQSTVGENY